MQHIGKLLRSWQKSKKINIDILKIKESEKEKNHIFITLRHGKVYRHKIYLEKKKMLNMKTKTLFYKLIFVITLTVTQNNY